MEHPRARSRMLDCVAELEKDSSPGYPYMLEWRTNGDLIAAWGAEALAGIALERVRGLSVAATLGAVEMVSSGLADPIRLFVKNELHSKEKVAQGRMRLIMSVSVVDQLVERFLFKDQNRAEIASWEALPSKPGLGLADEGLSSLLSQMTAFNRPVETDVSGFDWSVKGWMLQLDCEARILLAGLEGKAADLYRARFRAMSLAVFILSDGLCYAQAVPGIQKSGSYLTGSTNSRMRYALAIMAGAGEAICMGDDSVEEYSATAAQWYKTHGILIKEYKEVSLKDGIEFCGTIFRGSEPFECTPVRWTRMLAKLLSQSPQSPAHRIELLTGLRFELRHSPHLASVEEVISQSGWGL